MSFNGDLRNFKNKTVKRVDMVTRKIVFDVGTSLVLKSPVGDASYWHRPAPPGYVGGRFRANWQYGVGSVNLLVTENVDAGGGLFLGKLNEGLKPGSGAGKVHFLTNSLAYGPRLEEGWSRQAPNGFRRLTIIEFQPIVAAAARALSL